MQKNSQIQFSTTLLQRKKKEILPEFTLIFHILPLLLTKSSASLRNDVFMLKLTDEAQMFFRVMTMIESILRLPCQISRRCFKGNPTLIIGIFGREDLIKG